MSAPPPAAPPRQRVRRVAVVVGLLVVAGALAGVVWELLWTPPQGVVIEDEFVFTSSGLTRSFDGTALYALVAAATGLLLGAAVALRADGAELSTLGAVALGSLLAAVVMALVGAALGPPDADEAAAGLEDYAPVEQDLRIEGVGAYLAFPSGALLGAGGVFLSLARRRRDEDGGEQASGDPTVGGSPGVPADAERHERHLSGDDPAGQVGDRAPPR